MEEMGYGWRRSREKQEILDRRAGGKAERMGGHGTRKTMEMPVAIGELRMLPFGRWWAVALRTKGEKRGEDQTDQTCGV